MAPDTGAEVVAEQALQAAPAADLAPFVECCWEVHGGGDLPGRPQLVIPDGRMELIVELGPVSMRLDRGGRVLSTARGVLAGQFDRVLPLATQPGFGVFGVRFRPWGAAGLLRFHAHELHNRTVSLDDFFARDGRLLEERLALSGSFGERVRLAQEFLRGRRAAAGTPGWLPWAVQQLGTSTRVAEVARGMQVTPRQLERRFAQAVGLPPKVFSRLARFRRALTLARGPLDLTTIAHRCGYADQAHLTRDCRSLTDLAPTLLLARLDPLAGALSGL
jgi:AraC-like DNA-binding protein